MEQSVCERLCLPPGDLRKFALPSLAVVHLGALITMTLVHPSARDSFHVALCIGTVMAQISLFGLWCTITLRGRMRRVMNFGLFAGVAFMATILTFWEANVELETGVIFGASLFLHFVLLQGFLWVSRHGFGWRSPTDTDDLLGRSAFRFSIRKLLFWTTAVAAIAAAARYFPVRETLLAASEEVWFPTLAIVTTAMLGVLISLPMLIVDIKRRTLLLVALFLLLYVNALISLGDNTFACILGKQDQTHAFCWFGIVYVGWILASLSVARLCGLRVDRWSAVANSQPPLPLATAT